MSKERTGILSRSPEEEAHAKKECAREKAHDKRQQEIERRYRATFARENPVDLWGSLAHGPFDRRAFHIIKWGVTVGLSWKNLGWELWAFVVVAAFLGWHPFACALLVWVIRTRGEIQEPIGEVIMWCAKAAMFPVSFGYTHLRGKVGAETHLRREGYCNSCPAMKSRDIRVWTWKNWLPRRETVSRRFCRGIDLNQQGCGCPDTRASANEHRVKLVNASCIMGKWPRGNVDDGITEADLPPQLDPGYHNYRD